MATSRIGRTGAFLLAMLFLASTIGVVFLAISQSNDQNELSNLEKQLTEQNNQEVCKVSASSSAKNIPPEPPVLSGPVSELQVTDIVVGSGDTVQLNDCITVNYRLTLADGSVVAGNDTFTSGQPIAFDLIEGGLIEGWTSGLPGSKVGGLRRLVVPSSLGYGSQSAGTIPPNSDLVFDVEILDTKR